MAKVAKTLCVLLFLGVLTPAARGQFISVAGGGLFSRTLSAPAPQGRIAGAAQSDFSNSGIIAVDGGMGVLPFLTVGLHYSFSRPELSLRRGDAFGSSAVVDLSAHTLTFDVRVRTPHVLGFRVYGLAGAGFSRFLLDVQRQVEVPFPGGTPDGLVSPVFTFGGGMEKSVFPLVHLKLEVRDYVTPISEQFFQPGGAWHRVAVLGGIVLGR